MQSHALERAASCEAFRVLWVSTQGLHHRPSRLECGVQSNLEMPPTVHPLISILPEAMPMNGDPLVLGQIQPALQDSAQPINVPGRSAIVLALKDQRKHRRSGMASDEAYGLKRAHAGVLLKSLSRASSHLGDFIDDSHLGALRIATTQRQSKQRVAR